MNLGQLIGMALYPELRKSDHLRQSAMPPLGTVTRSSNHVQTVIPPVEPPPSAPAAAPAVEVADYKAPLRDGTTEKIFRILAAHPAGLTGVEINERLGGPFVNAAALLAAPRKRGDVDVLNDIERPFVYQITLKGRARL